MSAWRGRPDCRRATSTACAWRRGQTLFGSWEMNWLAYNIAHDLALPGALGPEVGFLMCPQAAVAGVLLDCLDPDNFKYTITAKELAA